MLMNSIISPPYPALNPLPVPKRPLRRKSTAMGYEYLGADGRNDTIHSPLPEPPGPFKLDDPIAFTLAPYRRD